MKLTREVEEEDKGNTVHNIPTSTISSFLGVGLFFQEFHSFSPVYLFKLVIVEPSFSSPKGLFEKMMEKREKESGTTMKKLIWKEL